MAVVQPLPGLEMLLVPEKRIERRIQASQKTVVSDFFIHMVTSASPLHTHTDTLFPLSTSTFKCTAFFIQMMRLPLLEGREQEPGAVA